MLDAMKVNLRTITWRSINIALIQNLKISKRSLCISRTKMISSDIIWTDFSARRETWKMRFTVMNSRSKRLTLQTKLSLMILIQNKEMTMKDTKMITTNFYKKFKIRELSLRMSTQDCHKLNIVSDKIL
jgi:hypothetical protein